MAGEVSRATASHCGATRQRNADLQSARNPARPSVRAVQIRPLRLGPSSIIRKISPPSTGCSGERSNPRAATITRIPPQLMPKASAKNHASGCR